MKNLIYWDNLYLIMDMGILVQICNLLNYVKSVFRLIFWRIFAALMLIYDLPTFEYGRKEILHTSLLEVRAGSLEGRRIAKESGR